MAADTFTAMYRADTTKLVLGFRYSTDNKWLVPHFEKMLYDNALWLLPIWNAIR